MNKENNNVNKSEDDQYQPKNWKEEQDKFLNVVDRLQGENRLYLNRLRGLQEDIQKTATETQGMTLEGSVKFLIKCYLKVKQSETDNI